MNDKVERRDRSSALRAAGVALPRIVRDLKA